LGVGCETTKNNLRELWALLNFLMPDIFGDAEQFDEWFSLSDESAKDNVIRKLHTVLRPFMLRRVKRDVATGLPPKKETKLYIGLTKMQQEWYVKVLTKDAHELNMLGGPDRVRLLNIMMQLRKVCNHPYLFDVSSHMIQAWMLGLVGDDNGAPPTIWRFLGGFATLMTLTLFSFELWNVPGWSHNPLSLSQTL
jgi:SNF2 family DNA or RNA helicase